MNKVPSSWKYLAWRKYVGVGERVGDCCTDSSTKGFARDVPKGELGDAASVDDSGKSALFKFW